MKDLHPIVVETKNGQILTLSLVSRQDHKKYMRFGKMVAVEQIKILGQASSLEFLSPLSNASSLSSLGNS